ncbi:hypothetical protein [Comamonas sp.]|uniref:hypothetical protein n=1 Tax=Comamonas sp. TaxID=34028 RepID=UPI0012D037C2|nr:hypothetical protein [Comamonas sp.]MPS93800.1 hypothetical protein [Comamonas sp.]
MKYELYRAACAGEPKDEHIASLTEVELTKPSHVKRSPGTAEIVNGRLAFKTADAIDGLLAAQHEFFIVGDDGERFYFNVSRVGQPITVIDGKVTASIY